MKQAVIIRYGAYGDIIHCSMVPRLLVNDGYQVTFEYNLKGHQLLSHNPYITHHHLYEPTTDKALLESGDVNKYLRERWNKIYKDYDLFINLNNTLERGTIALEDMEEFDWPQARRAKIYDNNYYEFTLKCSGLTSYCNQGIRGEIYYTDEEHKIVEKYFNKFKYQFVLIVNLAGTGLHKIYPYTNTVIQRFLDAHPNVHIITTGDTSCQLLEFKHDRIHNKSGIWPFRQALLAAKYANGVLGCESGLMVGATMWDTPTCQLMTAASINCHVPHGVQHDYSLQSSAHCSPCFTGPYGYRNCARDAVYNMPICVTGFEPEKVFQQLESMYQLWVSQNHQDITVDSEFMDVVYESTSLACPLCQTMNAECIRKNNAHIYYACDECGILYTDINNIDTTVYNDSYIKKHNGMEQLYLNEYVRYMPEILKRTNTGRFLEVGATTDVIINNAYKDGFKCYSLDINPHPISLGNKHIKSLIGNFEKYNFDGKKFNVIWMTHVFEHFLDPLAAIDKITNILHVGGTLFLAMPDPEQINWNKPLLWNHWHAKEHYIMWTSSAISNALKHRGFTNIEIFRDKTIATPVTGDYHLVATYA